MYIKVTYRLNLGVLLQTVMSPEIENKQINYRK